MKWRKNDNLNFICSWLNGSVVVFLLLLGGLSWWHSEESVCNTGDPGLIPGSGINLEKAMAPYSSTIAWKIPWMEEPGGLQSIRSRRVGN